MLYTALHVALPRCCILTERQGLFVRFTQFRAIFHRVQWLTGEKIRPSTSSTSANGWQDFPRCTVPLALLRAPHFRGIVQRLSHGWNDMFRENFRKRGNSKGVSNGFVISAVLVKEVRKRSTGALHNVCSMGLSVVISMRNVTLSRRRPLFGILS